MRDTAIDAASERLEPILETQVAHAQHPVWVEIRYLIGILQVVKAKKIGVLERLFIVGPGFLKLSPLTPARSSYRVGESWNLA